MFRSHPSRLRRAAVALALLGTVVPLALSNAPASAAPQTAAIALADLPAGPTGGTLSNQVGWTVDRGVWSAQQGYSNAPSSGQPQIWSFDRPVSVYYSVAGLNQTGGPNGECVIVPEGTVLEELSPHHTWIAALRSICRGDGDAAAESFFSHGPVTDVTLFVTGGGVNGGRGPKTFQVTYNEPVASVTGPADGGEVERGTGTVDFSCADGTGAVTGAATLNGDPIADGASLGDLEPGTYTLEVTCTDEHGATHTSTSTFTIVDTTPPAVTVTGPADGATYEVGEPVTAAYTCEDLGLVSCDGPVPVGGAIDTSVPGTYTFTVTGTDDEGNITTVTVTYTVVQTNPPPVVTVTGPTDGAIYYPYRDDLPAAFACTDTDLVSCTAVDGNGKTVVPGQELDTRTPGTYTLTVTGTDAGGNVTTKTITYTVAAWVCHEDGFAILRVPHSTYALPLGNSAVFLELANLPTAVSKPVHDTVEPLLATVTDPLTGAIGLPLQPLVHQLNCFVAQVEDRVVDPITKPVVKQVKKLVGGLLGSLL